MLKNKVNYDNDDTDIDHRDRGRRRAAANVGKLGIQKVQEAGRKVEERERERRGEALLRWAGAGRKRRRKVRDEKRSRATLADKPTRTKPFPPRVVTVYSRFTCHRQRYKDNWSLGYAAARVGAR